MKNLFLIFFLFLLFPAHSQQTKRDLLASKYSFSDIKNSLVSRDNYHPYPQTSAEWKAVLSQDVINNLIQNGEEALSYDFLPISGTVSMDYKRSGDRLRHSGISFAKRNKLTSLIIAESIEDKGRFTEAIFNAVWSICEESFWGVPAHISGTGLPDVDKPVVDLFAAETASTLALTDYLVGEKLDQINPLIRKRIYSETNRRIFVPMLTNSDSYGWMSKTRPVNNWNPWIMSNWMMSNLLLENDENRRAEMLYGCMKGLDLYFNSLGDDAGCDEGPSYWFAAGGSAYDCLELLGHATNNKVDIFGNEFIQKMASYVYKTHIDGHYFVNFADADPKLKPDGLMLYRFGKAMNDPKMMAFGQWGYKNFPNRDTDGFMRMRRIENLLTIKDMNPALATYEPVNDAWVSDIQVLTARAGKGIFLATHGGHNAESHNHNDVGDFIIYLHGQPMIVDAGRGNYTARTFSAQRYELWFTQSEYHNLPIINGIGQKAGREFEAEEVKSTVNDKEASLQMNLAKAYPAAAGIDSWNRTVKLNRQSDQVELNDEYVLKSKPTSLQQVFMTICDTDISKTGIIKLNGDQNQHLSIKYDPKLWTVSTELPSTEGMEYESFKTKWDNHPVTRIVLTSKSLNTKGKYQFSFVPE